jgi:hypothetical protein
MTNHRTFEKRTISHFGRRWIVQDSAGNVLLSTPSDLPLDEHLAREAVIVPELLAALDGLMDVVEPYANGDRPPLLRAYKAVRAVLAKKENQV